MYIVVTHDRHTDDQYKLFTELDRAVDYAKMEAKALCRTPEQYQEQPYGLFFAECSPESDCVYVQEIGDPE